MTRDPLRQHFVVFEPTGPQINAMEEQVIGRSKGRPRSLLTEWLELLRGGPVRAVLLTAASAALVFASFIPFSLLAAKATKTATESFVARPARPAPTLVASNP